MPNTELTLPKLTDYINTELGGGLVEVELTEGAIRQCVERALRTYNRNVPGWHTVALPVTQSQERYPLDLAVYPGLTGIIKVEFIRLFVEPTEIDPFNPYQTLIAGLGVEGSGETFGALNQRLDYAETAARVVSADPDWIFQWEGAVPVLYVNVPTSDVDCSFTYSYHYTVDSHEKTGMQLIPDGDVDWIQDFAVARGKQILSRIRGKFQGIPTPEGSVDPVDFSELASEGRDTEERLMEEIRMRRRPLPPTFE